MDWLTFILLPAAFVGIIGRSVLSTSNGKAAAGGVVKWGLRRWLS